MEQKTGALCATQLHSGDRKRSYYSLLSAHFFEALRLPLPAFFPIFHSSRLVHVVVTALQPLPSLRASWFTPEPGGEYQSGKKVKASSTAIFVHHATHVSGPSIETVDVIGYTQPTLSAPLPLVSSLLYNISLELVFCAAALRRSDGNYVINGNWAINWSGEYEAVGTRFTYRRQDSNNGELIEAPGPLLEPVDLMVGTIRL